MSYGAVARREGASWRRDGLAPVLVPPAMAFMAFFALHACLRQCLPPARPAADFLITATSPIAKTRHAGASTAAQFPVVAAPAWAGRLDVAARPAPFIEAKARTPAPAVAAIAPTPRNAAPAVPLPSSPAVALPSPSVAAVFGRLELPAARIFHLGQHVLAAAAAVAGREIAKVQTGPSVAARTAQSPEAPVPVTPPLVAPPSPQVAARASEAPERPTVVLAPPVGGAGVAPRWLGSYDRSTAVYEIASHTVYLPDGRKLEAHSGLGSRMDDPRSVRERMRGATPPHVYEITPLDKLFHGVRALRLNPVGDGDMFGRDGILAHTYMLGPRGDSNGCVVFKDYKTFLEAFDSGVIRHLAVVARLN